MVFGAAPQSRMSVHSGRAAHCVHATLQSHRPNNRPDSRQARRSANRELLQASVACVWSLAQPAMPAQKCQMQLIAPHGCFCAACRL